MIIYKHDELGFNLTAYSDGEPVAWIEEQPGKWLLYDRISIHDFGSFTELQNYLEKYYG